MKLLATLLLVMFKVTVQDPAYTYQNQNGRGVYQKATPEQTPKEFAASLARCPTRFRPGFRFVNPSNGQGSYTKLLRWENCKWKCLQRIKLSQKLIDVEQWLEEATIRQLTRPKAIPR